MRIKNCTLITDALMANSLLRKILLISALCMPQASQLQESTDWAQQKSQLKQMRQTWMSHDIHNYSFLLDRSCFGCFTKYPASVLIKDDKVVAVLDPDSREPIREKTLDGTPGPSLWPEQAELFPTIDELFDVVENAINDRDGSLQTNTISTGFSVEYDEMYGIPLTISIDNSRTTGGRLSTDSTTTFRVSGLAH